MRTNAQLRVQWQREIGDIRANLVSVSARIDELQGREAELSTAEQEEIETLQQSAADARRSIKALSKMFKESIHTKGSSRKVYQRESNDQAIRSVVSGGLPGLGRR